MHCWDYCRMPTFLICHISLASTRAVFRYLLFHSKRFYLLSCPVRHFAPQPDIPFGARCYFKPWLTLGPWPSLCRRSPCKGGLAQQRCLTQGSPRHRTPSEGTGTLPACEGERKEFSSSPVTPAAHWSAGMQPQRLPFVTRGWAAAQPQVEKCIHNSCAGTRTGFLLEDFAEELWREEYIYLEETYMYILRGNGRSSTEYYVLSSHQLSLANTGCSNPFTTFQKATGNWNDSRFPLHRLLLLLI